MRRGARGVLLLVLGYGVFLLVGLFPINWDFTPAPDGVKIYVLSSLVHADIVVPIDHELCDWRTLFPREDFKADTSWATHVAIGWGDRGFYLETPRWEDLRPSTTLNAMFLPSYSVVHASCLTSPEQKPSAVAISVSRIQYAQLCRSLQESLAGNAQGVPIPIAGASYGNYDAFYEARGWYHCFSTCNSWVGRQLASAEVTTPLWTPLPGEPCLYLD